LNGTPVTECNEKTADVFLSQRTEPTVGKEREDEAAVS